MTSYTLWINVTTDDGELLERASITIELDDTKFLDAQRNDRAVQVGRREAGNVWRDALGIVFSRARNARKQK